MCPTKIAFIVIQCIFLPQFQFLKIPVQSTTRSNDFTTISFNQSHINMCCPCVNTTKLYINKNKSGPNKMEKDVFRLPKSIWPIEYNLSLKINFHKFQKNRFDEALGNVSITIKVRLKTDSILIHCGENIALGSIFVYSQKDEIKSINLLKAYTYSNVINITLKSELDLKEKYVIDIFNFTARYFLNEDSGILTRIFESENGTYDYILATQLEPESARNIFPCFDEPKFKSIFNVKITTNAEFNILANSPEIECKETKNWKTCLFEPTPIMSTYNLAFSINNFDYVEHVDSGNVTFRIWTRQSQINNSLIALNFTVKIFSIFENMFKLKFPLRKVDSLAIPNLKVFLGMEHFGLITYDESVIVQDERFPLTFSRQLCVLIICHEVSHQWFGNIVTTAWWQDLWLNEGFATYYSYKIAAKILENDVFYPLEKHLMMKYLKHIDDFYSFPHATVNYPVTKRAETKFDYLSYKKSFIIISMIEEIMNSTSFDLSMRHYINNNKYESVYPEQLWTSLNRFSNTNLKDVMKNWISKFCYPIVTLRLNKNNSLNISQKSSINFDKKNLSKSKEYVTNQWSLPLFVIYGNTTFQSKMKLIIFEKSNGSLHFSNFNSSNHWIVINSNYISLFTVDYDEAIIDRLTNTLLENYSVIPPLTRAHILQDYYDSSKKLLRNNFKRLFKLLSYIEKETHPIPLITAITLIDKLNGLFELRSFYLSWHKFIGNILKPSFKNLVKDFSTNFSNPNSTDVILRRNLLNIACKLKLEYCQTITDPIIDRWEKNSLLKVDFDLLHIALCTYIQQDKLGENWIRLYRSKIFQSWDFINVKYYAMGCSRISWVIEKNIDIAFNVLQNSHDREKNPHVSSISIDEIPSDHLHAITPLANILILSSTYNYPNFQTVLIRFTRSGLHLLCNSIIFEPHFPIPRSIIEYAIPTLSHYNFIGQLYNYPNESKDALLIDAKANIEWMQKMLNLEIYLKEYND